jgi:glycosyltransferase involved in cell wall biosynthesis
MMAGRPYVLHVADPWPDFPIAMGAVASPYLKALAYGLEAFAYRHASIVTTVTRPLVEQLDRKQAARGKVRLLPNGVDTSRFLPDVRPHDARAQLGWPEARLTVVYAGTVGLAQGMQTLIEAALKLRSDGVTFVVVGQGQDFATLQAESFRRGISNVKFLPGVPTSDVPRLLAAADAILVMLKRGDVYRHWLPAKLLEGLAAGRPILASCDGEPARIVSEGNAGLVAAAEDADALARACIEMRDRVDRPATGTAAREVALASYDRLAIVRRLITYLQQASSNP